MYNILSQPRSPCHPTITLITPFGTSRRPFIVSSSEKSKRVLPCRASELTSGVSGGKIHGSSTQKWWTREAESNQKDAQKAGRCLKPKNSGLKPENCNVTLGPIGSNGAFWPNPTHLSASSSGPPKPPGCHPGRWFRHSASPPWRKNENHGSWVLRYARYTLW